MNLKAASLATGILWGFLIFAITLIEAARGAGHTLSTLSAVYPGYTVTYVGSIIGLIYGLVSGAIIGAVYSWLYGRFAAPAEAPKAKEAAAN